jgi:hypothetical protein
MFLLLGLFPFLMFFAVKVSIVAYLFENSTTSANDGFAISLSVSAVILSHLFGKRFGRW